MRGFVSGLLFLGETLLFGGNTAHAVLPTTHVSQYGHTAWRVRDGVLTAPPNAIAQSSDGYIWIGNDGGLFRFDGTNFTLWSPPHWDDNYPGVQNLLAATDGTLWMGTTFGVFSWKDGKMSVLPSSRNLGPVNQIREDPQHRIWLGLVRDSDKSVCQVEGDHLRCFGNKSGLAVRFGEILDIAPDGTFIIASHDTVARWSPERGMLSAHVFPALSRLQNLNNFSSLDLLADGSVLAGIQQSGKGLGLQRLKDGSASPFVVGAFNGSSISVSALFTDRAGSIWIGTNGDGLYKIAGGTVDHFSLKDGLSGNTVSSFLEDREGNFWVATDGGIDCFHDLKAISWSAQEGLTAGVVSSVLATHDGSVLVGGQSALNVIRHGSATSIPEPAWLASKIVLAMAEDRRGRYWISFGPQLLIYDGHGFNEVKNARGESFGAVSSFAEAPDGRMWARVNGHPASLVQVADEKVAESYQDAQISYALASNGDAGIWVTSADKQGRYFNNYVEGRMQRFAFPQNPVRERSIVENSLIAGEDAALYTTTSLGVVGIKAGKTQDLGTANGLPCKGATGLVFSRTQSLFILASCGLIEVSAADLKAWWSNPKVDVHATLLDALDGIDMSTATYFPLMSLAQDGRIWIGNGAKVEVIDPDHRPVNSVPPAVHIEQLVVDRVRRDPEAALKLPPLARDIEIDYVALSFSVPQKLRFRYMLEGRDLDWQEVGSRRTALYQDLKPGSYRFRVIAANNDGVWNTVGDTLSFTLQPAWFQTTWFRALWITTLCILVWSVYQLRVRSIAKAISARFDERLDERTRMALELHDTFLQTVQGSKMVADDALDPASDETRMRHALERLSVWLGQAVSEGRAALHALRVSTTEKNHLAEYLDRTAREYCHRNAISVAVTVIGDAKDLHPIVRDEIARIALEAIRNASQHSRASKLEIELRYANELSLCFRDNGVGMDPDLITGGKTGHFGMQGMRDRSARIRAAITIKSTLNAGTQVMLRVPGEVIYRREKKRFFNKLRKSKRAPE